MNRPKRKLNPWLIAAIAGGMLYPPLVYFGMAVVPPVVLVMMGFALFGLRLLGMPRSADMQLWRSIFLIAAIALGIMLFLNTTLAVRVYPVLMSLSVAAVFGASLLFPPTVVERIARITEPDLPPEGVIYTRRVTFVWLIFLIINAAIAAATAIWGTLAQWTLWNGLISYLLMGALFTSEFCFRQIYRRRKGPNVP